jgi:hypothetical protein
MGNPQNPQLEGDLDKVVMAGVALPPQQYIPVNVDGKGNITLAAGELQGMTRGSRFALFAADTKDFKNTVPKAEAEIDKLDLTVATLKLTSESVQKGVKPEALTAARAVEKSHQYGDNRLKVIIENLEGMLHGKEILNNLRAMPLISSEVTTEDGWDVRICPVKCPDQQPLAAVPIQSDPNSVVLQRQDGSVIGTVAAGKDQLTTVQNMIEGEARWRFVNALVNRDPTSQIQIELRLVRVEVEINESGSVKTVIGDKQVKRTDGGQFELSEGDMVMIELKNTGSKDAFVTVLDLQADGTIGPLWPYPGLKVQENKIAPDKQWHRIPWPLVFENREALRERDLQSHSDKRGCRFQSAAGSQVSRTRRKRPRSSEVGPISFGPALEEHNNGSTFTLSAIDPTNWATAVEVFVVTDRKSFTLSCWGFRPIAFCFWEATLLHNSPRVVLVGRFGTQIQPALRLITAGERLDHRYDADDEERKVQNVSAGKDVPGFIDRISGPEYPPLFRQKSSSRIVHVAFGVSLI